MNPADRPATEPECGHCPCYAVTGSCCDCVPTEVLVNGLRPGEVRVTGWDRLWNRLTEGMER